MQQTEIRGRSMKVNKRTVAKPGDVFLPSNFNSKYHFWIQHLDRQIFYSVFFHRIRVNTHLKITRNLIILLVCRLITIWFNCKGRWIHGSVLIDLFKLLSSHTEFVHSLQINSINISLVNIDQENYVIPEATETIHSGHFDHKCKNVVDECIQELVGEHSPW